MSQIDRLWNNILWQLSVHFRHPWCIKKPDFTRQVITRTLSKINKRNSVCERILFDSTRGTGKSSVRPTSWCLRTELIASLERGVCSCAELRAVSCYRVWKEVSGDARDFNNMETRAVIKFFFFTRQGAERNLRNSDRNIRGNIHHRVLPSTTGWPSLNVVIFSPVMRLVLDDPKQWPSRRLLIKTS